jgi:hypothetical protein
MKFLRHTIFLLLALPAIAHTQTPIPEIPNAVPICTEAQTCVLTSVSSTSAVFQFGAGTTWCTTFTNPKLPITVSWTSANPPLCPFDPIPNVVKTLVAQQGTTAYTVGFTLSGQANTKTIAALGPTTPTITWATPASVPLGTALSATQLNASASTAGTFVYTPNSGSIMSTAGTVTLSTVFTPTDTVHFTTAKASVPLTVTPKAAVSTFPAVCTTYSDGSFSCAQNGVATPVVTQ